MSLKAISLLKVALIAAVIPFGLGVLAATSGTNDTVAVKVQPDVQKCIPHCLVNLRRDAELKEEIVAVKAEYKDRWKELKDVHDQFMTRVSTLVSILGIAVAIVGVFATVLTIVFGIKHGNVIRELRAKVESSYVRLEEIEKSYAHLRRKHAVESRMSMRFAWVEFLHAIRCGNIIGREITHPLYRAANTLELSSLVNDNEFLNASIIEVSKVIDVYRRAVATRPGVHGKFVSFVRSKRILADSSHFINLVKIFGGKTESLQTVLKFFNEFGIKMFGEVV